MKEKSIRQRVFELIKEYLRDKPEGAYYSDIIKFLKEKLPDVPINTLHGSVWDFRQKVIKGFEKEIVIPERGLYLFYIYQKSESPLKEKETKIKEEDFYEKFADYLVNELNECTKAIALDGNKFQDRWGTPDVLGVYKFSEIDPIKPPLEIISAEIKIDETQLITAFGQACAYKIFSHKVYLVIPLQAGSEILRIESLCMRFGIGLITFDKNNIQEPNFQIRTRAMKSEPDYFYVNNYIKKLSKEDIQKLLS